VDGVRAETGTLTTLSAQDARRLTESGVITGGMAMKVEAALDAAAAGIVEVVVAGKARLTGGFAGTRVTAEVLR
jgi:acetylglutamate kinase